MGALKHRRAVPTVPYRNWTDRVDNSSRGRRESVAYTILKHIVIHYTALKSVTPADSVFQYGVVFMQHKQLTRNSRFAIIVL